MKDPEETKVAQGLKMTRCNNMGGVKCYHMEENAREDEEQLEAQKQTSLLTEMKHVVLKKSGMHWTESCFPNRPGWVTHPRVSTICVLKKRQNVRFWLEPGFQKKTKLHFYVSCLEERGKEHTQCKWLQKLQTFSITFPPKKLRVFCWTLLFSLRRFGESQPERWIRQRFSERLVPDLKVRLSALLCSPNTRGSNQRVPVLGRSKKQANRKISSW